ncbi:ankyrin repeat domain-containing protein 53 [Bombina bombina]|uniref:ankyrin repeat domain-containing protein 53 n=1 Tax=Bombina bombina TaxID=8345 RepID=UPI00235A8CD5|nr:ankyrin repeat domain-containing protein 53 [Bombina bombina]
MSAPQRTIQLSTKSMTALNKGNLERDQLTAAATGNVNWLQLSIKNTNNQIKTDRHGFTAIHLAALHGQLQCLRLLAEDYTVSVNLPSYYGWRPLHLVLSPKSGSRALDCVQYLLQQGGDVNVYNKNNVTPLHQAASEGLYDCLVALVQAGADVHAKDSQGYEPIDLCKIWGHRSCVRYLRNAMWKKNKNNFAHELKKMEKIKCTLEEAEQNENVQIKKELESLQHLRFCEWIDEKGLPERLKKGIFQPEVSSKSKQNKNHTMMPIENKKGTSTKPKRKPPRDDLKKTTKISGQETKKSHQKKSSKTLTHSWNPCVSLSMPPNSEICRTSMVRLGTNCEETTMHDLSNYVYLSKDKNGHLQIKTRIGEVLTGVPNLPCEVIKRCLFPNANSQERIQNPQDFKAKYVFDLPKKRPPLERKRPVSDIVFHLHRTIDLKYDKPRQCSLPNSSIT